MLSLALNVATRRVVLLQRRFTYLARDDALGEIDFQTFNRVEGGASIYNCYQGRLQFIVTAAARTRAKNNPTNKTFFCSTSFAESRMNLFSII